MITTRYYAAGGYVPPVVNANASASDIEDLYRQYAQANGGDTLDNRNAAIDYLRQSGVSDSTMGQAYTQYSQPDPGENYFPAQGAPATGTSVTDPGLGNVGSYIPSLQNTPDSNASKANEMTPTDIAKWYYGNTAGIGGDSVYQREKAIDSLRSMGVSDARIGEGWQEYLKYAGAAPSTLSTLSAPSSQYTPSTPERSDLSATIQPPPQHGGLTQVAAGAQTHLPVAQSVSTPSSIPASDAISDHTINSWFLANPGWNTDMLKGFMSSYGLTPEQVARATGRNPTDFIKEVNAAGRLPAQAGAQTQYVDYTQPLSPIAQGAGSGNLPYYYNTPAGSLASYYNPTYLRGNISAYGGMMGKDLNLRQSVPAAPPPVQSVTYVPPPSPSPAPTTVPGLAPAAPVATQSDFDTWYADYMRRQNLLDRGFGTGSGSDGIGGGSEGSNGSSDGPSGEA